MTKPYIGIPAPKYLKYDPWFGPPILSEEQQKLLLSELYGENILIAEDTLDKEISKGELDNIHKVMYNLATQWKTKLGGGSETYWI